ncbi:MAG: ankyrin repeat domain-containing protein [Chlamydiales bacterium]|nr:ankyrin repeat domain-containing protein [Chlamydiales bacterium]
MTSLSVLSNQNWQTLFSEERYKQAVLTKKPVVEFLIALGRPDNEVMQYAKEKPINPFRLSVLDLAIMKGRESLVAKLLAAGAKVDEPDFFGWLPIHHACLASDAIFAQVVNYLKMQKKRHFCS